LIDRIRHDIQERLEQLLVEAEKLRHALAALDPREPKTKPAPRRSAKPMPAAAPAAAVTVAPPRASTPRKRAPAPAEPAARARSAPGATKTKVLGALSADGGMTATEVANATGPSRGTASTTLSKLAKSGEITKAERGYRLPAPG
jgi:CRP-like cAMP-binding protein